MSFKLNLVRAALNGLHYLGVTQLCRPLTQGKGVIFCMHRVQPNEQFAQGFSPNSNLTSTPEFLEAAILHLKRKGFEFIPLGDVLPRLRAPQEKPFAVFTLDDGYKDNLIHAMPVFRRHQVPFTVYIAPGLVDGTTEMWWLALEAMIRDHPNAVLEIGDFKIDLKSSSAENAWNHLAPRLQALPEHEQRHWTREHAKRFTIDLKAMCTDIIMNWDEIRSMAKEPLATIGAHTLQHFAVKKLTSQESQFEILESGKRVASELAKPVQHFAYPYGNVDHAGPRDFAVARDAGYETAVTTRLGTVFDAHQNHPHALPRVMVSGRFQNPLWLDVLASGFPSLIKNYGKQLNVD